METKRILIPGNAYDGSAINTALQWLTQIASKDTNIKECIVLIPTKSSLDHTSLSKVLGENPSKKLKEGSEIGFHSTVLRCETKKTFKGFTKADAVLAVYADSQMMDAVDSNGKFGLVICVPHIPEAVDEWKRTWNPMIPGQTATNDTLISNKIVKAALKSITNRINLGNKILNPSDTEAVKDAFRILRAHNQKEDPKNIRAWCIKNGWDSKGADEAMKHASKAFSLKTKPSKYGQHWAEDIYQQWSSANK